MSIFATPENLAYYLSEHGIECSVIEDDFIKLPVTTECAATLRLAGSWVVFKCFIDLGYEMKSDTLRNLLIISDRLIGFRFAIDDAELWALQDLPTDILSDRFYAYIDHLLYLLENLIPALKLRLAEPGTLSEEDVNTLFEFLEV